MKPAGPRPPRAASRLLSWLMPGTLTFSAMGDYAEIYSRLAERRGLTQARIWYWSQVMKAIPLSIFWGAVMLKSYARLAWRNLLRQKAFSLINISGLAIGIACAILIGLWVRDELSFDRFHPDAENIYWIGREIIQSDQVMYSYETSARLAEVLPLEFPEILNAAAFNGRPRALFHRGDRAFYENGLKITENDFFRIFGFPFIKGDPETALADTSSIVITESVAKKYFGDEDPIGKTLNWNTWLDYRVSGVIRDPPPNTHLQFGILLSYESMRQNWPDGLEWKTKIFRTYVRLRPDVDPDRFAARLNKAIAAKYPGRAEFEDRFLLLPITRIRHHDPGGGGSIKYVTMFFLIALFILGIAGVNFTNLSTARSTQRAREVGLRKVLGSRRPQLARQFFSESFALVIAAYILSLILVQALLPAFNDLSEKNLSLPLFSPWFLLSSAGLILLTGLIAGIYPALLLSSYSPGAVLQGRMRTGPGGAGFRRALVVLQFALSIGLVFGTVVVHRQLEYMRNRELGFDKDNVVYISLKAAVGRYYQRIKASLLEYPEITAVTAKDRLPLRPFDSGRLDWEGMPEGAELDVEIPWVGYDYFETLGMKITQGRDFSREYPSDVQTAFIANREAVRRMGLDSPVGTRIRAAGTEGILIGVVENAHFRSRAHLIYPEIYRLLPSTDSGELDLFGVVMIRLQGGKTEKGLGIIENMWRRVNPDYPFEYHFLDDAIDAIYTRESKINSLVDYFSLLAVFISCMGLFGLASFMTETRTKEIGVRKVLGASSIGIVRLITREFALWVAAAGLIAGPIAWLTMDRWLRGYAYRIQLNLLVFLAVAAGALIIALLTVIQQALRAARADPVEALRHE